MKVRISALLSNDFDCRGVYPELTTGTHEIDETLRQELVKDCDYQVYWTDEPLCRSSYRRLLLKLATPEELAKLTRQRCK